MDQMDQLRTSRTELKANNQHGTHSSNQMKALELAFWRISKEVSIRDHRAVKIQKVGCLQVNKDLSLLKVWTEKQLVNIPNKSSLQAKFRNKKEWTLKDVKLETLN